LRGVVLGGVIFEAEVGQLKLFSSILRRRNKVEGRGED
jgi:hypothetical protein